MVNEVDYFEIGGPDPEGAKTFYGGLFDWSFGDGTLGSYSAINGQAGGLWDTTEMGSPTWAIFYVHVADVAESVAKAVELGATVAIPLIDNGQITFAHLVDPSGRRFAVWTPNG